MNFAEQKRCIFTSFFQKRRPSISTHYLVKRNLERPRGLVCQNNLSRSHLSLPSRDLVLGLTQRWSIVHSINTHPHRVPVEALLAVHGPGVNWATSRRTKIPIINLLYRTQLIFHKSFQIVNIFAHLSRLPSDINFERTYYIERMLLILHACAVGTSMFILVPPMSMFTLTLL